MKSLDWESMRRSPRWSKRALAFVLILAAAALWLLARPARAPHSTSVAGEPSSRVSISNQVFASSPANSETAPSRPRTEPPVVDRVELEKAEVCSGEENLVTVRAHSPDGDDRFLHSVIGSQSGFAVPIRIFRQRDGSFDMPSISVTGRDGTRTQALMPYFRVKDCAEARAVVLAARVLPNTQTRYEIQARVAPLPNDERSVPSPFQPVAYAWRFGDGAVEESAIPVAEHDFAHAIRDRLFTSIVVQVEVRNAAGESLKGRTTIDLQNPGFENLHERGVITLLVEPNPRFPELGAQGVVTQSFQLRHLYERSVKIERIGVTHHYTSGDQSPEESVDLAVPLLLPRAPVALTLSLDTEREPDVAMLQYRLQGKSEDGKPALGSITLMKPPARPTREAHVAVTDVTLVRKIRRARELLHKEFVTDEEIWALERSGALAAR